MQTLEATRTNQSAVPYHSQDQNISRFNRLRRRMLAPTAVAMIGLAAVAGCDSGHTDALPAPRTVAPTSAVSESAPNDVITLSAAQQAKLNKYYQLYGPYYDASQQDFHIIRSSTGDDVADFPAVLAAGCVLRADSVNDSPGMEAIPTARETANFQQLLRRTYASLDPERYALQPTLDKEIRFCPVVSQDPDNIAYNRWIAKLLPGGHSEG